jgi:hypothetical protein
MGKTPTSASIDTYMAILVTKFQSGFHTAKETDTMFNQTPNTIELHAAQIILLNHPPDYMSIYQTTFLIQKPLRLSSPKISH